MSVKGGIEANTLTLKGFASVAGMIGKAFKGAVLWQAAQDPEGNLATHYRSFKDLSDGKKTAGSQVGEVLDGMTDQIKAMASKANVPK